PLKRACLNRGSAHASRSSAFLSPPSVKSGLEAPATMVGRGGCEPPKAYASRFTVCPLWPLGYLPESAGRTWQLLEKAGAGGRILTPDPLLTRQLLCPLSYASTDKRSH